MANAIALTEAEPGCAARPSRRSVIGAPTGVELRRLRAIGGRPVLLAGASWLLVAGLAYIGVAITTR